MNARSNNLDYSCVGGRLKIERCRLGLSQTRAGAMVGVSARTWRGWEAQNGKLTVDALESFAEHGADAVFILTGSASKNWDWSRVPIPFLQAVDQQFVSRMGDDERREVMRHWFERDPRARRDTLYRWLEFEIICRRHGHKRSLRAVLDLLKVELG